MRAIPSSLANLVAVLLATLSTVGAGELALAEPVAADNTPTAATLSYVDSAKLPLATAVIKAFRHAKHSERHTERHTGEMGDMSYRNVTELSVTIPAKVAFKHGHVARASMQPGFTNPAPTLPNHPHKGKYTYAADFTGSIRPENLVAVSIGTNQDTRDGGGVYGFELGRTTHDGPTNPIGMHWLVSSAYIHGSRDETHYYASCTAEGGTDALHPIMSEPILTAGMRQAMHVLILAQKHRPIKRQKDVFASQQPAQDCP